MIKNSITRKLAKSLGANLLDDLKPVGPPLSTGCKVLDLLLQGGIPRGMITEIVGDFSTGKSLLGLQLCREAAREGNFAVIFDAENTLNKIWAVDTLHINPDLLITHTEDTLEKAYDFLDNILDTFKKERIKDSVIVWDSVAATLPAVLVGEKKGSEIAAAAVVHSKRLPKLLSKLRSTRTSLVLLNQERSKIGVVFGQHWESFGGKAIRYYSSLRLRLIKTGKVKSGRTINGVKGRAEIIKSRICRPYLKADFEIDFMKGIPPWSGLLTLLTIAGIIKFTGALYVVQNTKGKSIKFKAKDIEEVYEKVWKFADKKKLEKALFTGKDLT
tara:strand:- start:5664 stop:6650 length:987 start_codon:yes stop_codon:yes gene_type:complete